MDQIPILQQTNNEATTKIEKGRFLLTELQLLFTYVQCTPVLSNVFDTVGRIRINIRDLGWPAVPYCQGQSRRPRAAIGPSKQRLKFSEHYKLHGCNAGPSIPLTFMNHSLLASCPPYNDPSPLEKRLLSEFEAWFHYWINIRDLGWPAVPYCQGQSRNGEKCPASRPGSFRDNETSQNEHLMLLCSFNEQKVRKYISNFNKFICSAVQSRYVSYSAFQLYRLCCL